MIRLAAAVAVLSLAGPGPGDDADRKPLKTVVPAYPAAARLARIEGDVQVCFHVDREGRVHRPRVRSSSARVFEKPAVRAARASRYVPLPDGVPVPVIRTCRTFRFRLPPAGGETGWKRPPPPP